MPASATNRFAPPPSTKGVTSKLSGQTYRRDQLVLAFGDHIQIGRPADLVHGVRAHWLIPAHHNVLTLQFCCQRYKFVSHLDLGAPQIQYQRSNPIAVTGAQGDHHRIRLGVADNVFRSGLHVANVPHVTSVLHGAVRHILNQGQRKV